MLANNEQSTYIICIEHCNHRPEVSKLKAHKMNTSREL